MKDRLTKHLLNLICLIFLLSSFVVPVHAQDHKVFLPFIANGELTIKNGGFEGLYADWSWYPSGGMVTAVYSRSGIYSAMLGDGSHNRWASVSQQVSVPASNPTLVFHLLITSSDICSGDPHAYDYTKVTINNIEVFVEGVCANNSSGNWVQKTIDLSAYAGQTVTLSFVFVSDESAESRLFLDDVQIFQ
jgi:aminopeptidase S